jgi:sporulation protein YlmC with PRC-barrel domain
MVKYHRREELTGKELIDSNAKKVGVVRDIAYSLDGKIALIVERSDAQEAVLAFDKIEKIGDVVFIKSVESLEVAEKVCPNCKHKNPLGAKFCFRCGKKIPEE